MFVPENSLEELLSAGGQSPQKAMEFYKEFLNAMVVTLGSFDADSKFPEGIQQLERNTKFNYRLLAYKNEPVVAVFSSVKRMREVIPEEYYRNTGYVQFGCRDLLQNVASFNKPTPVVLNPGHMLVMLLPPDRVRALLDGSLFTQIEQAMNEASGRGLVKIPKGAEVIVGKPSVIPTSLMSKMADYFRSSRSVERAWIGQIVIPSSGQKAHLLVCLKLSANPHRTIDEVWADLIPTVKQILPEKEILDLMDAEGEAKAWLERLIPFYP